MLTHEAKSVKVIIEIGAQFLQGVKVRFPKFDSFVYRPSGDYPWVLGYRANAADGLSVSDDSPNKFYLLLVIHDCCLHLPVPAPRVKHLQIFVCLHRVDIIVESMSRAPNVAGRVLERPQAQILILRPTY